MIVSLALAAAVGCGKVRLVDPDAALKANLRIADAQRLEVPGDPRTYLFVRITSREAIDRVRLSLSAARASYVIPAEALTVRQPCDAASTCLSITAAPGIPAAADRIVLSVPELGHTNRANVTRRELGRYAIVAEATARNTKVLVSIDDPIRRHFAAPDPFGGAALFPRSYESIVAAGACAGDPEPADPGWAEADAARFEAPAPYPEGDDPLVCVSIRPRAPGPGPAAARTTVPARAVVTRFDHVYQPPVENAPLVYLPLFDLELTDETRCAEAEGVIAGAVADGARQIASISGATAEILALDPVRLAQRNGVACKQDDERRFDASAVRARIEEAIETTFGGERRVRVLLVYAQNLDLALPLGLVEDIAQVRRELSIPGFRDTSLLAIAPPRASASLEPDFAIEFGATEEAAFRTQISTALQAVWPFRTMIHGADTIVPLAPAAERARFSLFAICSSSNPVNPLGIPRDAVYAPEHAGPAYQVTLPELVLLPPGLFMPPAVRVRWEGCERLCDHAAPGGAASVPWARGGAC